MIEQGRQGYVGRKLKIPTFSGSFVTISLPWGGAWYNIRVVAFRYINNCRTFPVGLEEPPRKSESLKNTREDPVRGRVGFGGFGSGSRAAGGLGCGSVRWTRRSRSPTPREVGQRSERWRRAGQRSSTAGVAERPDRVGEFVGVIGDCDFPLPASPVSPSSGPSTSHGNSSHQDRDNGCLSEVGVPYQLTFRTSALDYPRISFGAKLRGGRCDTGAHQPTSSMR